MSANTPAAAPAKSKKWFMIVIGAVLVLLILAGGAVAWIMYNRSHAQEEDGVAVAHKEVPTFLPLENMVVNLADPGGDRFAQIGITLEVADAKTADQVKQYLPSIRSGILILVSQRTSEDLLQREGKEALAVDILREVSRPLGYAVPAKKARNTDQGGHGDGGSASRKAEPNPVRQVLFSSFIIQ